MITFLTSNFRHPQGGCNPANGFVENLNLYAGGRPLNGLFIPSNPSNREGNDRFLSDDSQRLQEGGLSFRTLSLLDGRNAEQAEKLVSQADFIYLSGGHVPTENRFFNEIHLGELLHGYGGVLMGMSAGSMNCAETVYASPEEKGEAVSRDYKRFLKGLGITKINIIPHFGFVRTAILDGLHLVEEVICPDSMGREFYLIPDGSYILCKDDGDWLYGEAYLAKDGGLSKCNENGSVLQIGSTI